MDIVYHGSGCVADICNMNLSSCEHPYKPSVDCSEAQLALLGLLSRTWNILKNPSDLGGTEICVDDETCLTADLVCKAFCLKAVAIFGSPSVLPDDGIIYRFSGLRIPYYCRLSLIRDADSCYVKAVDINGSDGFGYD